MLLVANREKELFANADERLTSRLTGCERVRFDRYSSDELISIMDARAKSGLEEGAVNRDQLATIANAAAGDARVALSILRTAARQAHQNYETRITDDIVEEAMPQARAERHQKDVDTLTPTSRRSTKLSRSTTRFRRATSTRNTSRGWRTRKPTGRYGTTFRRWISTT